MVVVVVVHESKGGDCEMEWKFVYSNKHHSALISFGWETSHEYPGNPLTLQLSVVNSA